MSVQRERDDDRDAIERVKDRREELEAYVEADKPGAWVVEAVLQSIDEREDS